MVNRPPSLAAPATSSYPSPVHWTLLLSSNAGGVDNMARDEALMSLARDDLSGWFRVYGWTHPVLSLGRHQRAVGVYNPDLARSRGIEIVRRPTGGRAVLHWHEITYAAAAPISDGESLNDAASMVNELLTQTLSALGVDARLAVPTGRAPSPDGAPCFALPVRGELIADSMKLVGSAQWRDRGVWMQHGSILVGNDQGMIAELAVNPQTQPVSTVASMESLTGRKVGTAEFGSALSVVLSRVATSTYVTESSDHRQLHLDRAASLLRSRYEDVSWTWHR